MFVISCLYKRSVRKKKHYRKTVVNERQIYNPIQSIQNILINNNDEVDQHDSIAIIIGEVVTTESSENGPASIGEYLNDSRPAYKYYYLYNKLIKIILWKDGVAGSCYNTHNSCLHNIEICFAQFSATGDNNVDLMDTFSESGVGVIPIR